MINIKLVTIQGCHTCKEVKELLQELKADYKLNITEVNVQSEEGDELSKKHSITAAPGLIINEELFSTGAVEKGKLKTKLDSLTTDQ